MLNNTPKKLSTKTMLLIGLSLMLCCSSGLALATDWVEVLQNQDRRVVPEWEPALGAVLPWQYRVPRELIRSVAENDHAFIMVTSQSGADDVAATMAAWGISEDRYDVFEAERGSAYPWVRDWGGFSVLEDSGEFHFYDGAYDYPKAGLDNIITNWICSGDDCIREDTAFSQFADFMAAQYHDLPIALTGGNMIFDGLGLLYTSEIYIPENEFYGYSLAQSETILTDELGVSDLRVFPNYESYGIQHVDCLFLMLDSERVIFMRTPEDYPTYDRIEEIHSLFASLTNSFGRPYEIHRVDAGWWETFGGAEKISSYTNSMILNKHVYVPLFGIPEDQAAMDLFESLMPGYEIHGFEYPQNDQNTLGWTEGDALHCRTRQIYDPNMLRVVHRPLDPVVEAQATLPFTAYVRDYSGQGLQPEEPRLFWRTPNAQVWDSQSLFADVETYFYSTDLAGFNAGDEVLYYISATDQSGRVETSPVGAPHGYYSFTVETATNVPDSPPNLNRLVSIYPNPFNPNTSIQYQVVQAGNIKLQVFNAMGRLVKTLVDETETTGLKTVRWDGRDRLGEAVASGVYFCRLESASGHQGMRMVLLK